MSGRDQLLALVAVGSEQPVLAFVQQPTQHSHLIRPPPHKQSLLGLLNLARRGADDATARLLSEAAANAADYNGSGGPTLLELVIRLSRAVA